jgi:hypothetical protein
VTEELDDAHVEDMAASEGSSSRKKKKARFTPPKLTTDDHELSPAAPTAMSTTNSSGIPSPVLPSPVTARHAPQQMPPTVDPTNAALIPASQPVPSHPTSLGPPVREVGMADVRPMGDVQQYFNPYAFHYPGSGVPVAAPMTDPSMYPRIPTTYTGFSGLYTPSSTPTATYNDNVAVVHPMYPAAPFDPNQLSTGNVPINGMPDAGYGFNVDEYNARMQMMTD